MTNPLLEDWTAPYGAPPLDRIAPQHFPPAYDQALAEHVAEIAAIAENPRSAHISRMSWWRWKRAASCSPGWKGCSTTSHPPRPTKPLQAIELEMAPRLSAHWSAISMHPVLFARLDAVYRQRDRLGLDAESLRVLERYHLDFVRAGAQLKGEDRDRLAAIAQRLAVLGAQLQPECAGR